jgi:hypothetical protein
MVRFRCLVLVTLLCGSFASGQSEKTTAPAQSPQKKATHTRSSEGPSCGILNPNVDSIAVADFDTAPQYGHANPTLDLSTDTTQSESHPLVNTGFPNNGRGAGIEYLVTKCTTGLADKATLVEITSHEIAQCGVCGQGPGCGQNPGGGVGFYPVWTQKVKGSLLTVDVSMAMVGPLAGRSCSLIVDGGIGEHSPTVPLDMTGSTPTIKLHVEDGEHQLQIACVSSNTPGTESRIYWECRYPSGQRNETSETIKVKAAAGEDRTPLRVPPKPSK